MYHYITGQQNPNETQLTISCANQARDLGPPSLHFTQLSSADHFPYIYTHTHTDPSTNLLTSLFSHGSGVLWGREPGRSSCWMLVAAMARCRSFLPLTRLLLLLLLGDVVAVAMVRPLLGIAEPPSPPGMVAAGPTGVAQPDGRERRPDRSIAGADVILAGFVVAVMAIIFCYIRVTRKGNDRAVGLGEKA